MASKLAVRTEAGSAAFLCHLCTSAPAEPFGRDLLPPALAELLKFAAVNFSGFLCRDVATLVTRRLSQLMGSHQILSVSLTEIPTNNGYEIGFLFKMIGLQTTDKTFKGLLV